MSSRSVRVFARFGWLVWPKDSRQSEACSHGERWLGGLSRRCLEVLSRLVLRGVVDLLREVSSNALD